MVIGEAANQTLDSHEHTTVRRGHLEKQKNNLLKVLQFLVFEAVSKIMLDISRLNVSPPWNVFFHKNNNFSISSHSENATYSVGNSSCNKALFMKQKCQIQMGVGQYKNAGTPLRTRGINTTHQHFQMSYINLIYLKGIKSYQPPNFECVVSVVKQTLHFYFNQ